MNRTIHMPRHSSAARTAALLAAVLLLGCAADERPEASPSEPASASASPDASEPALDPDRSHVLEEAHVVVEGTGAASFRWEGDQRLEITRVGQAGMQVNVVATGLAEPVVVADDPAHRFRWAFDLVDVYQDAPGTFTIEQGAQDGQAHSRVVFVWLKVKDPSAEAAYDMSEVEYLKEFTVLREPCTLELGEGERTGALVCPALATEDGEVAGLTVRWEAAA